MKPWVGVIHEAAFLFGGNPRIKKRQDITPTQGFIPQSSNACQLFLSWCVTLRIRVANTPYAYPFAEIYPPLLGGDFLS